MKKLFLHFGVLCFMGMLLFSCTENIKDDSQMSPDSRYKGNIDSQQAKEIASEFISAQNLIQTPTRSSLSSENLEIVYTDLGNVSKMGGDTRSNSQEPAYYVINFGEKGYVIVSGTEATLPVLGYSTESTFDPKNIPANMLDILSDYKKEILYIRDNNIKPDQATLQARKSYLEPLNTQAAATTVGPLLGSIKWNQSPYYNAYCPSGCPVGCVATATSQIMRYWKYPSSSTGYHSYRSSYGTLSFDYNYTINWSNMPASTLRGPNSDVAKFCYGVAVGLDMNFSPQGSGAYQYLVPGLLTKYYRYPAGNIRSLDRSDYNYTNWANMITAELDANRPVQYAGYGNGGGHSFVCDGYSSNGYFHFNWGWGGVSDGYFLLNALNPGSLGAGGGSGGFNYGQTIVIGIQPPNGTPDPDDPGIPNKDYCGSKALYPTATYIRNVYVGNINNYTGATSYSYFSNQTLNLRQGYYYSIYLTPGFYRYVYPMYWRVWIDYNGNKEFEDSEIVAQGMTTDTGRLYSRFRVPTDAVKGKGRMRVSAKWGGYPSSCETFSYGEVEDYNFEIQ